MPANTSSQCIKEVFEYIDAHNDTGVTSDELYEAGLFARKGDAASWLSRWKTKGFLTIEYIDNPKNGHKRGRYKTITDSSEHDWVYAFNFAFRIPKHEIDAIRSRENSQQKVGKTLL